MLDILKMVSWAHMGRTANIIIKDTIHIFASISKIVRILLMGRRNCERCAIIFYQNIAHEKVVCRISTILYVGLNVLRS